jgi:hypothetical protein
MREAAGMLAGRAVLGFWRYRRGVSRSFAWSRGLGVPPPAADLAAAADGAARRGWLFRAWVLLWSYVSTLSFVSCDVRCARRKGTDPLDATGSAAQTPRVRFHLPAVCYRRPIKAFKPAPDIQVRGEQMRKPGR